MIYIIAFILILLTIFITLYMRHSSNKKKELEEKKRRELEDKRLKEEEKKQKEKQELERKQKEEVRLIFSWCKIDRQKLQPINLTGKNFYVGKSICLCVRKFEILLTSGFLCQPVY